MIEVLGETSIHWQCPDLICEEWNEEKSLTRDGVYDCWNCGVIVKVIDEKDSNV